LREELAALCHEQWSGWMEYLFQAGHISPYGDFTLPVSLVNRWKRQMATPYAELSQEEKDSDRQEADKFLRIVAQQE